MTQNDCSCVSEKNYLSIGNCTNSFLFFFIFFRKPKLDNIARLKFDPSIPVIRRLRPDFRVKVSPILPAGTNVDNPDQKIGNINSNTKQENAASSDTSNITNRRGVSNLDGGSPE